MHKYWFAPYMTTFVAKYCGEIVGSYMVDPKKQGKEIGYKLCDHSINFAKESGYKSIQFNIVVSTNHGAIHLWKKFGFEIIGTTPKGFNHTEMGFVDTYIMYKEL